MKIFAHSTCLALGSSKLTLNLKLTLMNPLVAQTQKAWKPTSDYVIEKNLTKIKQNKKKDMMINTR